jgi:hypothetical protein
VRGQAMKTMGDSDGGSMPPSVESEKETLQEGVSKQVMKEGQELGPPPRHSTCFGV